MENEKVKEIKKALENCTSEIPCYKCKHYGKCEKLLTKENILTLINELESENERLSDELYLQKMADKAYKYNMACENGKQFKQISELKEQNKKFKDRIAELEALCNKTYEDLTKEIDRLEKDKTEHLKQFAERLKEQMNEGEYMGEKYKLSVFRDIDIDETLKEFTK